MEALIVTKNDLISLLQTSAFDHLSKNEQTRLQDYLQQILITLQDAADPQRTRRIHRYRRR